MRSELEAPFSVVATIIALVADPAAAGARLEALRKEIEALEAAQAEADAARAVLTADSAKVKYAQDEREKLLRAREVALAAGEGRLRVGEEIVDKWKAGRFPLDGNLAPGTRSHSGLVRE